MIPIKYRYLSTLADKHYEAVMGYINRPSTKFNVSDYQGIDDWVKNNIGLDWSFEKIIKSSPVDLEKVSKKILSNNTIFPNDSKEFINKLYKIFADSNGGMEIENEEKYNGFELMKKLKITVCPYCNRNFINNVDQQRTSEFDHYYNKDSYPLLAISFYNLIPSCKVCNKIKLANDKPVVNPYNQNFDFNQYVKLQLKIKGVGFYYNSNDFEIFWDLSRTPSSYQDKVKNHLEVFKLKKLYELHKDWVLEIIQKSVIYNDSYIDELFEKYEGTLFQNREDVLRMVLGNYITDDELEKRPLAKLTKDISEQLGLI